MFTDQEKRLRYLGKRIAYTREVKWRNPMAMGKHISNMVLWFAVEAGLFATMAALANYLNHMH